MKNPSLNYHQPRFTAAQIGRALGMSKRNAHELLGQVQPAGIVRSRGQIANGWQLSDLPAQVRSGLATEAQRQGYRDAEHLLCSVDNWQPPIPLAEVSEAAIQKAVKLQKAFKASLERLHDPALERSEVERLGVKDYAQVFGHTISERHWRRILKRTLERAGAGGNFNRLELFLEENPSRKMQAGLGTATPDFQELLDWMGHFKHPTQPTSAEEASLWNMAFELYASETEAGRAPKRFKKGLLNFLWRHAPWLASTPSALRRNFSRKLERWEAGKGEATALLDKRETRADETGGDFAQDDLDALTWHAARNCGGRVAQAVREMGEQGSRSGLTPDMVHYLTEHSGQSKSYVPKPLRDRIAPEVKMLLPHLQGPRAADMAKASLVRDYSAVYSKLCYQADDFTLPVYFYIPDGKGWYKLTRGQCLIMIDFRSLRILNFSLQPDRNYNSGVIRTLCARTFAEYGLPKLLYFEKGIWKSSKLVKGSGQGKWLEDLQGSPFSWPEVEIGLQEFGVKFIHANRPRAKTVERVGGLIQDLMERFAGYCGRDERKDCPEATKRNMAEVANQKEHPSKHFMSFEEWLQELQGVFEKYNAGKQEGRVLAGLSPDEAFEKYLNVEDPPISFGPEVRPLLAHHKMIVPVKQDGIKFKKLGQEFIYRSEAIGHLRFQKVLAWWNPEAPETITVTTLDRKSPVTVERYTGTPALSPDPEQFARDLDQVEGFARYGKTRYVTLKAKFAQPFRQVIPDRQYKETVQLCETMERQQVEIRAEQRVKAVRARSVERKAGNVGVPTAILNGERDLIDECLELMETSAEEHRREQKKENKNE